MVGVLRSLLVGAAMLCLAAGPAMADNSKYTQDNDVYVLGDDNFYAFLTDNDMVLAEFCMSFLLPRDSFARAIAWGAINLRSQLVSNLRGMECACQETRTRMIQKAHTDKRRIFY